ncbi:zinc-binding dehydrogenase [Pseudoclavibacter sp. 13-3]|uniref:zinc-binding dehydrogenase n=1 Tax=Pseudoclavibacter sp. 13-3 TaxID=2901228 RepID=UPI001E45DAC6|nr:zinc-binding dehydrogenase [Pseudoclavibacter sp. 13-3]MCD7101369.1 zinc-binding dehydrogenase [Pseudoclavibacter sp. 13-3]
MTAATEMVWLGADRFDEHRVEMPELWPGEVLVRVLVAGVCGSDRHTVLGHRDAPCPSVLGHESVGEIVAIGSPGRDAPAPTDVGGGDLQVGDRVVWSVTVACGQCDRCRAGVTAKCRHLRKVGHERADSGWPLSGGYASHMLLPVGTAITRVPDRLGNRAASLASCAGGTAVAALEVATRMLGRADLSGLEVLVVGAGALGTIATAGAVALGGQVAVCDLSDERLRTAGRFGARVHEPGSATAGCFDVALEFSGTPSGVHSGLAGLRLGGVLVMVGAVSPIGEVAVDPEHVVRDHLTITGVHNYEPRHLVRAVELLARDPLWEELVEAPLPLARLHDALLEPAADSRTLRRSVAAVTRG